MVEVLRLLVLCGAGVVLFRTWRWLWSRYTDPTLRAIVTAGFLLRVLVSQVLFWISFLGLPLARSLQSGNGLWFFAQDATIYTANAARAASEGLPGILAVPRSSASAPYAQALGVFTLLFGHPVAVSLLLNAFCFLGSCAIILRWNAARPGTRNAAIVVALCSVSFAPGGFLWALQPLKDTFFQFAIVSFMGAALLWQTTWRRGVRLRAAASAGLALVASLFVVAGVRWYFGLILLAGSVIFLALVAWDVRPRRALAFLCAAMMLVLLSRTVTFACGPFLPPALVNFLNGRPSAIAAAPHQISERIELFRRGFTRAGGATLIRPGRSLSSPAPAVATATISTTPEVRRSATVGGELPAVVASRSASNEPAPAAGGPSHAGPTASPAAADPAGAMTVRGSSPAIAEGARKTVESVPWARAGAGADSEAGDVVRSDQTRMEKFGTGVAAVALSPTLSVRAGLVDVKSRSKLWWYVELDTLFFDALLLFVVWSVVANLRNGSYRNGVFWLLVPVTVMIGIALAYTVTNFGTLFRLRLMLSTLVALIPLTVMTGRQSRSEAHAPAHVEPFAESEA